LHANIDDIHKLLKNEKRIINFMNEQYMEKYPDQQLADTFFDMVFSNKPIEDQNSHAANIFSSQESIEFKDTDSKDERIMPVKKNLCEFGI